MRCSICHSHTKSDLLSVRVLHDINVLEAFLMDPMELGHPFLKNSQKLAPPSAVSLHVRDFL